MMGETVSHFEVLERIGQGGMGVVFKARDRNLDRFVALKFLPFYLSADEAARERFSREARTASALDHPNICTVYEIGESEDGRTFIAMGYYDGESLKERLARGPMTPEEAIRIAVQVARGLAEAHARGIIHRDIKPGNIAITRDGTVKILDFGLATLAGASRLTQTDSTSGTVAYMSPEQARGDGVDTRTDLWSLGVVMFEMLTGELPFRGDNAQAVIFSLLNREPRKVSSVRELSPVLVRIVERALAKDPASRYQTAEEILADLSGTAPSESVTQTMIVPARTGNRAVATAARRFRWPAAALALVVLLLAIRAISRRSLPPARADGPPVSTSIAVLPFQYRGNNQYRYLGDGMVALLSAKLDHAGELRTIDPRAIAGLASQEKILDPVRGRAVAERLNARYFVLGTIVEIGDQLQIDAGLYRTDADVPAEAAVRTTASGEVAKTFDLVDTLAIGLLTELDRGFSTHSRRVSAVTTSSLPALRAYLDGESAFQSGDFRTSVAAFQSAVALDPHFALAWYRLSIALEWLGTPQELHNRAAEQAYRNADRLTDRDRRLLEASRVWRQGANQEAKRLYQEIVHIYPDEIEGWYQLGEVLFHRNGLYGASFTDSRAAFEKVLAYEPNNFASLVHLARIEAFQGHLAETDSLVARFLALGKESSDHILAIRALQAFARGDQPKQDQVLAELDRSEGPGIAMAFLEVSLYARNLSGAERIARLLTAESRPPRVRSYGHVALAHLALARGQWAKAKKELESIASYDPWTSLEYRALFSSLSFLPAGSEQLTALRDGLKALDPARPPAVESPAVFIDAHYDLHPLLRMYLMALVSARMGDVDRAREYAGEIGHQNFPPGYKSLAADLTASVGAQIDRIQGRPAEAAKQLESLLTETRNPLESPVVSEAYERYTRAELLHTLGRDRESLASFDHMGESCVFEFVYLPLSRLWSAEARSRAGDKSGAASDYRAFIDLWKDSDPELSPMVELARQKLEALGGAPATPAAAKELSR